MVPDDGDYGMLYVVLVAVATLPFAYYAGFVREHQFGLSNETAGKWLADWGKA